MPTSDDTDSGTPREGRLRRAGGTTSAHVGAAVAALCAIAALLVPDGLGDVMVGAAAVAVAGGFIGAMVQSRPKPELKPKQTPDAPVGTYHYLCPWRVADLHTQLFHGVNIQHFEKIEAQAGANVNAAVRVGPAQAAVGRQFTTSHQYQIQFQLSPVNQLLQAREALSGRGLLHYFDDDAELRWYTPPTRSSSNEFVELSVPGTAVYRAFTSHPAETCHKPDCRTRARECTVEASVPVGPQDADEAHPWAATIQLGAWGRTMNGFEDIDLVPTVTVLAVVRTVDRDARSLRLRALSVSS